mgnify:CR=1 FL=1
MAERVRDEGAEEVAAERKSLQERLSAWLDLPLAVLSLVWAGLLVVELAADLPPEVSERIYMADIAIWGVFAVAFLLEFAIAPHKGHYLRTHVLAAISVVLPFARAFRILGLARALRSVSLVRVTLVANRASAGIAELFSRQRFHYLLALTAIVTVLGAAAAFYFERDVPGSPLTNFAQTLWWAAALVTTINIGADPVSFEARVVAFLLRVFAVGVFGYVAGSVASFLIGRSGEQHARDEAVQRLTSEVEALRRQIDLLLRQQAKHDRPADEG